MTNKQRKETPFYLTDSFNETQRLWYEKLEKSGFCDLEYAPSRTKPDANHRYLKKSTGHLRRKMNYSDPFGTEVYQFYAQCREYSHYAKFSYKFYEDLWLMFADGVRIDDIADRLRAKYGRNLPMRLDRKISIRTIHPTFVRKLIKEEIVRMKDWLRSISDDDEPVES